MCISVLPTGLAINNSNGNSIDDDNCKKTSGLERGNPNSETRNISELLLSLK